MSVSEYSPRSSGYTRDQESVGRGLVDELSFQSKGLGLRCTKTEEGESTILFEDPRVSERPT